jgi:hypothetical protein
MDKYIYIKSNESDFYFSDNKPYKFKVHLKTPMIFDGFWKVALIEFYAEKNKKNKVSRSSNNDIIYITSDIIKESIVQGTEQPVLRRLRKTSTSAWNYIFDTPYYLPLQKKEFIEFEIIIKDDDNEDLALFLQSPLYMTLHFKRYPFYNSYESL